MTSSGNGTPTGSAEDENNPMRWAKKPWNHLGMYTREEAIELLGEKLVSQKRRVLMKDCVRIIYYCHVQRSSGCRYEMSVCIPKTPDEKVRIDDFQTHSCNMTESKQRRRAKPSLEDFDRPIEPRRERGSAAFTPAVNPPADVPYTLGDSISSFLSGLEEAQIQEGTVETHDEVGQNYRKIVGLELLNTDKSTLKTAFSKQVARLATASNAIMNPLRVWSSVDADVIDLSRRPDGPFTYMFHAIDQLSRYSFAYPMVSNQPGVVAEAALTMLFQFGPPEIFRIEPAYKGTQLVAQLQSKFPHMEIVFYSSKRNPRGDLVPRREAQLIKERVSAWLMECPAGSGWVKQLGEMKYNHNSEWIEELESTPMEVFFSRRKFNDTPREGEEPEGEGSEHSMPNDPPLVEIERLISHVKTEQE